MKTIKLTNGADCLIDDEDFERVSAWGWMAHEVSPGRFYVRRTTYRDRVYLHRFILGLTKADGEIDHRNGNTLDNTRENLRPCTSTQNKANMRLRCDNRTGYKGVFWRADRGKYIAYIRGGGRGRKYLGHFLTAKDAALAYNEAARQEYGEFARLNEV
jgi:hypothetical protein